MWEQLSLPPCPSPIQGREVVPCRAEAQYWAGGARVRAIRRPGAIRLQSGDMIHL